jgi:hypothetical protein
MKTLLMLFALPAAFALGACNKTTSFNGEAHFPGGPNACAATCEQAGLEMSGFVYSGEFATSCVCRPPGHSAPGASGVSDTDDEAVTEDAVAVGVVMQMRAEEERRRHNQQNHR